MSKHLFFCFLIFTCSLKSFAQLDKGALWLGGNISYGSATNKENGVSQPQSDSKGLTVSPFFGKSINQSSIIGISLVYKRSKQNITGPSGRITGDYDYGGGVFYRRYKALGRGFNFYVNGEVNYTYATRSLRNPIDASEFRRSKINYINLIAYPGLSYALKKNIFVEIQAGNLIHCYYRNEKQHQEFPVNNVRDLRNREFGVESSFNELFNGFGLGFRFLLGRKDSAIK